MSISKSKQGLMALKIDLEKAFNGLEWGFTKHILSFFNFPTDWIELIMSFISSFSLSVLVNGEHLNYFLPSRGIRQGDPLSPYILIFFVWSTLPDSYFVKLTLTRGRGLEPQEMAQPSLTFSSRTTSFFLLKPPNETAWPSKTRLTNVALFPDKK